MRREKRKTENKIGHQIPIILWMFFVICSVGIAAGQTEPNQAEPNLSEFIPAGQDKEQISAGEEDPVGQQLVQSINFRQDMPIKDVLRFLAAKYHKNIIPSAKVDGKINISNLYDVTFEEALDAVLGHNFFYKFEDNSVKIYSKEEYDGMNKDHARMSGRVFSLCYVNAAEVKALIMPVLSDAGKIGTTTAAALDTEAGKGGDTLSMRDTIVVYDFPETLDLIGKMIKEIDIKPQQILIEVTILKATLSETTQFGINWSKIGGLTATSTPFGLSANLANSAATAFTATLNNDEITAAITAQEGITNTTVLANPKIMALNKQAGYINIGEERGYTASTTQGQTTTTSVDFLISGTILKFRPFVCDNGYIRMEINPELSTSSIQTDVNSTLPLKTITQVKSNIMVKDGKTIIIGGLFKEDLTSDNTQVPGIGDVPFIGALFKRTKDANIRTEFVILITPHIIDESSDIAAKNKEEDVNRLVYGSRKKMNLISRMRIYENIYADAVRHYTEKKYDKALGELNWIIGFRPDVLDAVKLKEKIIAETSPDKYKTLERIMLNEVRKEQEIGR
jgi:type II secretory pathway component GspD/PulD (secretin)